MLEEEISNIFESPQTGSCSSETNRMNVVMQLQHQQPLKFFSRPHFRWWTVASNGEISFSRFPTVVAWLR
jgi:hypothetical protein